MAEPNESENRSNRKRKNLVEGAKNASSLVIETAGKKRRKKRRKEGDDDDDDTMDPLVVFGSDIMLMILSYLDARSVALSLLVSRRWHGIASSDRLWTLKVTSFPTLLPLFLFVSIQFIRLEG